MKLYYSRGACSLSAHIVACELGIDLQLISIDLNTKKTADGADFLAITPKGYVPALQLDDGRVLTEGPAIVQYLADLKPEKGLLPKAGSFERAKVQEWLNYIGTELHKNFGPLFNPASTESEKNAAKQKLMNRFELTEKALAENEYLTSNDMSVADCYLFVVTQWCSHVGVDISGFKALAAFIARMKQRDSVKAAIAAE